MVDVSLHCTSFFLTLCNAGKINFWPFRACEALNATPCLCQGLSAMRQALLWMQRSTPASCSLFDFQRAWAFRRQSELSIYGKLLNPSRMPLLRKNRHFWQAFLLLRFLAWLPFVRWNLSLFFGTLSTDFFACVPIFSARLSGALAALALGPSQSLARLTALPLIKFLRSIALPVNKKNAFGTKKYSLLFSDS